MSYNRYPLTSGTVTQVSVVTANGVSGSVSTPTSTPAITLTLGAITPSSVTVADGGNVVVGSNGSAFSAGFAAQDFLAANVILLLPTAYGAMGQLLQTVDNVGTLGWTDPGITSGALYNALSVINGKQVADLMGVTDVTLSGVQTLDGQPSSNAVIVCLKGQTDPTENGLWSVDDFGPWSRPAGWSGGISNIPGSLVSISEKGGGTLYSNTLWFGTGDGGTTSGYSQILIP